MIIGIFGGTGETGMEMIKQGLELGYSFKILARTPSKIDFKNDNMEIIKGDILQYDIVKKIVENTDAILVAIGADERGETHFYSDATKNIVKAMNECNVKRLSIISAAGVGNDPDPNLDFVTKKIIIPLFFKKVYIDMDRMEKLIVGSNLDYTIMQPPALTRTQLTGTYRTEIGMSVRKGRKISRADLAQFMVNNIEDKKYFRKKVGIAY
ncbi:MAG: SDR family oxidoreductase [archaeon]|nr:SDR family oxidoreductase [archaeon]